MPAPEKVDFIAERPKIFDNNLVMPWPDEAVFERLRDERLVGVESEPESWIYSNTLHNIRDEYFRMRYRGALWPYAYFNGEDLPKNDDQKLDCLLSSGYWAPATDVALQLYDKTEEDEYRQTSVFAGGLHIYDAINRSWGFLDPRFSNDSAVREKHFLTFLGRVAEVATLPMTDVERNYYAPLQLQFNLFYAEMAAQSSVSASRDLLLFDPRAREAEEYRGTLDKARASFISFQNETEVVKKRVVDRFRYSAFCIAAGLEEWSSPVFPLKCLHLFGLADEPIFYQSEMPGEPAWWQLSAEEIMSGDTQNLVYLKQSQHTSNQEDYNQDSLF